MTPQHLLALCVLTLSHAKSVVLILPRDRSAEAPDFWWDLAINHSAPLSWYINAPLTSQAIDAGQENLELDEIVWGNGWMHGSSRQWLAGGSGFWTAWSWSSSCENDITGGGFIYNETNLRVAAGANWLVDDRTGAITWNCFVDGNVDGSPPWNSWSMAIGTTNIGFIKKERRWGFQTGVHKVISKHCASGSPVIGKRYKNLDGNEVESSVKTDPFKSVVRVKRAPQWLEKVSQTLKDWAQKIKNIFTGGDQNEDQNADNPEGKEGGKKCFSVLDLMVRIIDLILGRKRPENRPEGPPNIPQPPGGVPQGPNGEIPGPQEGGGDPPGGADVPPRDVEEIDTAQNDAIRDWE